MATEHTDCDDGDEGVYPGAPEVCDGRDQDCDGDIDEDTDCSDDDGDGWTEAWGDCDDTDPSVHPGAADTAGDGVDSDCDGTDGQAPNDRTWTATDTGNPLPGDGCACTSAPSPAGAGWAAIGLLALLWRRRAR